MKKLILLLAAMATFATTAFAEIGSASSDLVYTPVTPCRIFDTRTSQGGSGAIAAAGTKSFYVRNASTFAGQGGAATDCGMTATTNIAAIAINIVVIAPTTGGYITAYPSDVVKPLAATINFSAGDVLGNASIVKVSQGGSAAHLSVFSTSQTDVAGDVVGYYSKPVATALECVDTANTTVAAIAPGGTANASAPVCATGYTPTATNCESTSWLMPIVFFHSGTCSARNNDSSSQDLRASRTCCRVPGR